MKDYIENFDWDDVHPIKASIASIITLFVGFGLMKLSWIIGGWWLVIPTWIVCIIVMVVIVIATFDKLFGD